MPNPAFTHMYQTRLWKDLRRVHLARYPLCARCHREGRLTPATVVHHSTPHKGDWDLFKDPKNLASSCAPCHDRVEQGIEGRGFDKMVGEDGWPVDPRHPFNKDPLV